MKYLKRAGLIFILAFAACQLLPIYRLPAANKANHHAVQPKVPGDPQVALILMRSCSDCHSSSAAVPWYGHVAPVSWLLAYHVTRGTEKFDLSAWETKPPLHGEKQDTCDAVSDRSMPLRSYTFVHPRSRLTNQEINRICTWAHASSSTALLSSRQADSLR